MDTQTVSLELDGGNYEAEIEVKFECISENYGADADGNRGMRVNYTEIDSWHITKFSRVTDNGLELIPFLSLGASAQEVCNTEIETYLDEWTPEDE